MNTQEFIPIVNFCNHHGIEISFINSLHLHGLVEIVNVNKIECIPQSQLGELEKYVRLHIDLEINTEGIDVVINLLQKIKNMQDEILLLTSKLKLYEK